MDLEVRKYYLTGTEALLFLLCNAVQLPSPQFATVQVIVGVKLVLVLVVDRVAKHVLQTQLAVKHRILERRFQCHLMN